MTALKDTMAGVLAALALAAVASEAAAQRKDVTVGVIESLTGPVALAGSTNACGFRVAADMLEAEGRPKNYKLVLNLVDDQSRPAHAVQSVTKLTSEGIKIVLGGTSTFTVMSALPVLAM